MTNSIQIRDQIISYIASHSEGLWYTIGYRGQAHNPEDVRGEAVVKVIVVGLSPDRQKSSITGEKTCTLTLSLDITCFATSQIDIATLDDPASTDSERAIAMAGIIEAEWVANDRMDKIFLKLFDLLMGGDGEWFGLENNHLMISDRWGDDFQKEKTERHGSMAVVSGFVSITCSVIETPNGSTPVEGTILYGTIDIQQGAGDPLTITTEV